MKTLVIKIIFLIVIIAITSCDNYINFNKNSHSNKINNIDVNKNNNDSIIYINQVKKMLYWYKNNYNEINSIELVDLIGNGDSIHYEINYKSVELYLSKLRKSYLFSDNYIIEAKNYFIKCNENLVENYQSDGPPSGLEYDLLLFTQEPSYLLDNIEKLTYIINIRGDNCVITIDSDLSIEYNKNLHIVNIYIINQPTNE